MTAQLILIITFVAIAGAQGDEQCYGQNQHYACRTQPDKQCSDIKNGVDSNPNIADDLNCQNCTSQCFCQPGTARDENNKCVPYDQCNKPCGPRESKDYCPVKCPSDYCPKKENEPTSCPNPKICPKPECKCGFNSRRAENGTCISVYDCPPFKCEKPFQKYNPCPPLCPDGTCTQATPDGRCPAIFGFIGIVLECFPTCRCQDGYWFDKDENCVPYDKCPGKSGNKTTTTTT